MTGKSTDGLINWNMCNGGRGIRWCFHCWNFSKIQNRIGVWSSNSVSRHIPREWKAKTLVDACILIRSNTVAKGWGSHCVHWWVNEKHIVVSMCKNVLMHVAMYMHLENRPVVKRQILYDFSYKRYLVWPCSQGQGIEHWLSGAGRKTHEDLQFDESTLSVLRMLYSVNAANPTEVSTHKWLW